MSNGLSCQQHFVHTLLTGKQPGLVCPAGGSLTTSELLEELVAAKLLAADVSLQQGLFVTRRACRSLERRGLLKSERVLGEYGNKVISWSAASAP